VVDGRNGVLHQPGDVSGLAAGLKRLAADVRLRRRLAEAGRETARTFTPDAVVGKMVELYASLARTRRDHG
jgi:glycosyltransferase involved in cell wall biosynthesis